MTNNNSKSFLEIGAVFNSEGFEESDRRMEETARSFASSFEEISSNAEKFSSNIFKSIDKYSKNAGLSMDKMFASSSKGFINLENIGKKTFNSLLESFLSFSSKMLANSLISGLGGIFGGGGSILSGVLGSRERGGDIPQTGPYLLHEGEYVLPKHTVNRLKSGSGGSSAGNINITVNAPINISSQESQQDARAVAEEISQAVRRGAAWAVEYAKISYKTGKNRAGEVSI
ncbi:hypothetical protein Dip518_000010 [Parelusimicrobium proximum]|uniref:hypothetical protein n=1 Tax=Parelusimicrobium proximum TaxID=3228953 RepID=UPI003D16BFBC